MIGAEILFILVSVMNLSVISTHISTYTDDSAQQAAPWIQLLIQNFISHPIFSRITTDPGAQSSSGVFPWLVLSILTGLKERTVPTHQKFSSNWQVGTSSETWSLPKPSVSRVCLLHKDSFFLNTEAVSFLQRHYVLNSFPLKKRRNQHHNSISQSMCLLFPDLHL